MGAEFALLLSKFAGFSRNFLDSVSSIDAYFWNIRYSFWGPISKRNTTGGGSLHRRGSLHEHLGTRAPGTSGHIVFLRRGSYVALVLAGGPMSGVCSSVWGLFPTLYLTMKPARCCRTWYYWRTQFYLYKVSFPFSSFCSVLFHLGSVPTQLLTILNCSVTIMLILEVQTATRPSF